MAARRSAQDLAAFAPGSSFDCLSRPCLDVRQAELIDGRRDRLYKVESGGIRKRQVESMTRKEPGSYTASVTLLGKIRNLNAPSA